MAFRLRDFGSYRVGGRRVVVEGESVRRIAFTASTSYTYDPNGSYAVESAYVQYFVPQARKAGPPVILLHGGGMTGAMWETTPDGRPGWLHFLLEAGFEVHVVDNVERGRAGWMPGLWEGQPFLRSMEEAWTLFRFGEPEDFAARRPFPRQQFPCAHLETLAHGFVPRWTTTTAPQIDALSAVLRRTGPSVLLCHSQGGEIAFQAAARDPERMVRLVSIEPSGFVDPVEPLERVPITIAFGDYLDRAPIWRELSRKWADFARRIDGIGGTATLLDLTTVAPGASHLPMMDRASRDYFEALLPSLSAD